MCSELTRVFNLFTLISSKKRNSEVNTKGYGLIRLKPPLQNGPW